MDWRRPGPTPGPAALRDPVNLGWVFFVGSIFFTGAAWLQWLEALNGDVAAASDETPRPWRWLGWCPRNLGYLACTVQLAGTLLFNFNTADAMVSGLSWREQDLTDLDPQHARQHLLPGGELPRLRRGLPRCRLVRAAQRLVVDHGDQPGRLGGLSALGARQLRGAAGEHLPELLYWSTLLTAAGALCFLVGAYLLIPELSDED